MESNIASFRRCLVLLAGAAFATLAGMVLLRAGSGFLWDDAWFFSRYADNFAEHGVFGWNPDEAPAYGLTSLAYGGQVLLLRLALDGTPGVYLWLSSLSWGLAALLLLYFLLRRFADAFGRHGLPALLMFAVTVGMNVPQLSVHFTSGMDTTLAMAYMALYLILLQSYVPRLSPGKALVLGLAGGAAWYVRPELLLFTLGVPLAIALFAKRPLMRRQAGHILIFTAFALFAQVLFALQHFGTFLPLSFYAKSGGLYGPSVHAAYRLTAPAQLGVFLLANLLPVVLTGLGVLLHPRAWWTGWSLTDKALLAGFLLYAGYQTLFVLPVMGYDARFLYPAWPVLVWLGGRSAVHLLYEQPRRRERLQALADAPARLYLAAAFTVLVAGLCYFQRPRNVSATWGRFDAETAYTAVGRHNWPYLERFSLLPTDMKIASTELGIPGAMNPGRHITDLSGLHDPLHARKGFRPERLVDVHRPDLIYMPHPDYREMRAALLAHPGFREKYLHFPADTLHSWLGLALRKDSPYFFQMKYIVEQETNVLP